MKNVFIASYDLEVGGVERSLISMLNQFDYNQFNVDLVLYKHSGDLMNLLTDKVNLLPEVSAYASIRESVKEVFLKKHIMIGCSRILAKQFAKWYPTTGESVVQIQYMWQYALPFLPKVEKEYDVAISYLWPHDFVAYKVRAKTKIAWIHTDYSIIDTNIKRDLKVWNEFDYIVSISDDVTRSFLLKYPTLKDKIILVENITSPSFVREMSQERIDDFPKDSEAFNLVSVGRLCYQKGFDEAIKALRLLHDKGYMQIKWYIVGYGGDEASLRELIQTNQLEESFILLGKKTNPYPYMKQCDLYVQPSRYEGKAVTVTEAKIVGKPVLLTNYETAPSQLTHGVDGYITDLSIEGIAQGIETLLNDDELRERLSYNCENTNYGNKEELYKLYEVF